MPFFNDEEAVNSMMQCLKNGAYRLLLRLGSHTSGPRLLLLAAIGPEQAHRHPWASNQQCGNTFAKRQTRKRHHIQAQCTRENKQAPQVYRVST